MIRKVEISMKALLPMMIEASFGLARLGVCRCTDGCGQCFYCDLAAGLKEANEATGYGVEVPKTNILDSTEEAV